MTRHGKEKVIAPVFDATLGCQISHVDEFDTDQLGSFTREIPRVGTQIDAARRKARLGMHLSGLSIGLASEGSFGSDPLLGMLPWNVEILLWIDDALGIEVLGRADGAANFAHRLAKEWSDVEAFAGQSGFPEHQLVVRPEHDGDPRVRKGIANWQVLEAAFFEARALSENARVFVETDVRAHANPTRMLVIRRAAEDLAARLGSACPFCATPGFWVVERLAGLACADCAAPTQETIADVLGCVRCEHRETRQREGRLGADPAHCGYCNP